jgi:hypothetical protein
MTLIPLLISVISLVLSVAVAWLTLLRRGSLGMTQPMLIGFLHEAEQPKIFFRAMLYATGKRGHIVEAIYLKVRQGEKTQTFSFWMYGETKELKIGSGLRVGEDGASFNHHFLPPKGDSSFEFLAGEYAIEAHAKILNRRAPVRLAKVGLSLSGELASALLDRAKGVLFTWSPESQDYHGNVSEPQPGEGRSRSISGAGQSRIPWA